MILAVIYYSFSLPWQFGIGGGCEFFVVMLLFVFKSFVSFWKQIISHSGAIYSSISDRIMTKPSVAIWHLFLDCLFISECVGVLYTFFLVKMAQFFSHSALII
jgi:hypothetical protein